MLYILHSLAQIIANGENVNKRADITPVWIPKKALPTKKIRRIVSVPKTALGKRAPNSLIPKILKEIETNFVYSKALL
jgi:hypothetical protein